MIPDRHFSVNPIMFFTTPLPQRSLTWTLLRLALASSVPVLLILTRVIYTHRITYIFLLWNLCLAWLPVLFAFLTLRASPHRRWRTILFAPAWLLFLPNAPYILTDIMHLRYDDDVPVLFDVAMLFCFALCGLVLGFVSLRWMQTAVARRLNVWLSRAFVLVVLELSGFGIYLGRYLRWNSWDIFTDPIALVQDMLMQVMNPVEHWRTWVMSMLFALVLVFVYWLLVVFSQMEATANLDVHENP